jgi:hypothetical protein
LEEFKTRVNKQKYTKMEKSLNHSNMASGMFAAQVMDIPAKTTYDK